MIPVTGSRAIVIASGSNDAPAWFRDDYRKSILTIQEYCFMNIRNRCPLHRVNRKMSERNLDEIAMLTDSAARNALRTAMELHAAATAELIKSQAPEHRLSGIVRELETAEHNLTACRIEDNRVLAAWLAVGAEGERPRPNERTLAAERAVAELGPDAVAARASLPEHQSKVQVCAERVRDLSIARLDAMYTASVRAVREFLDTEFGPAIQHLLVIEAKARSVERALYQLGHGSNPSAVALGCSVEVATAIRQAKAAARVPHNDDAGRRLLDRLMTDANASLE
jgi:hypothetical protein